MTVYSLYIFVIIIWNQKKLFVKYKKQTINDLMNNKSLQLINLYTQNYIYMLHNTILKYRKSKLAKLNDDHSDKQQENNESKLTNHKFNVFKGKKSTVKNNNQIRLKIKKLNIQNTITISDPEPLCIIKQNDKRRSMSNTQNKFQSLFYNKMIVEYIKNNPQLQKKKSQISISIPYNNFKSKVVKQDYYVSPQKFNDYYHNTERGLQKKFKQYSKTQSIELQKENIQAQSRSEKFKMINTQNLKSRNIVNEKEILPYISQFEYNSRIQERGIKSSTDTRHKRKINKVWADFKLSGWDKQEEKIEQFYNGYI